MEQQLGRREQRKQETRRALVDAAFSLFSEHGFDAVTMDDVASTAKVSRRTAFRYFPTKEALVFPHRASRFERFKELLAEPTPGERPYDGVVRACLELADDYEAERELFLLQEQIIAGSQHLLAYERSLDRDWEDAIADALARDLRGSGQRRARLLAAAMMGIVRGVLREWYLGGAKADLRKLGREGFALLSVD